MATTAATLVLKVVADTKNAAAGVDSVAKSTSSFKDKVAGASKVAGVALLGLGAAAFSAGKAAAEDAQSQAVLANSMKQSAGATNEQVAATEAFITKTALATGVADDQLRPAMGNLVRATGDVEKSQKALSIALDIAAATGKDVGTVTAAMAKGYGGNEAALNKLLPSVAKVSEKTGDFDKVMQAAAKTTSGAAAASANTAAGKMDRMTVAMDEAQESMGAALLPAMSSFSTIMAKVAVWVGKNTTLFQIIVGVVASLAAAIVVLNYAIKAYNVVTTISTALTKRDAAGKLTSKAATLAVSAAQKVATAAQWAWNAAVSANPIGLIVIAIIALVAIFVVLFNKNKTFRDFVMGMWGKIKDAVKAAAAVLKSVWKAALSVVKSTVKATVDVFKALWKAGVAVVKGYIQAWKAVFQLIFGVIKGLIKTVVAVFKGDWRGAMDAVRGVLANFRDFFRNIFGLLPDPVQRVIEKIKDGLTGAFQFVKDKAGPILDAVKKVFDGITTAVESLIDAVQDLVGWIADIDFPSPPKWISKIPGVGSIFSASAPAVPAGVSAFAAPRVGGGRAATTRAGGGVNIFVNGAIDPEATARQIQRILLNHDRRVGLVGARTP